MSDPLPLTAPRALTGRDPRLDFFRGLALVMIFINHVPGTVFEHFTNRNFGFTDAAEGFVLMSGAAAGLAYSNGMRQSPRWPTVSRLWNRAWLLYLVHLMTAMCAIAIVAAAALWWDAAPMLTRNNFQTLTRTPLEFLIGITTLGHQLGYVNILPMYMALLLATPLFLQVALWRPMALVVLSVLIWWGAAQFRVNLPNFPTPGGWFFNPFSWQIIFCIGLLIGVASKQGKRFVPVRWWLVALTAGFLVLSLVWIRVPIAGKVLGRMMGQLRDAGFPFYIVGFDKTFVSLPRLLHILALAYVLSVPAIVRRISASRIVQPVVLMGKNALPVFALGTILSILLQAVKQVAERSIVEDSLLLAGGLAVQMGFAWAKTQLGAKRRQT
ncbi:OpgC family protein [Phaeovulum sp.]|uniref:OpgC family protein n=1 Tax=Phaeovulum sp. TaxID=2934796 RepID=UPI0039E58E15